MSKPWTTRWVVAIILFFYGSEESRTQTPTPVTLLPTTSPSAGTPGVTSLSVTGSNFPAGTIAPENVTVTLTPASGGAAVTTKAAAVNTVAGTTRRVSFTIPSSVSVSAPTAYTVNIAGSTSTGTTFQGSNAATL